MLKKITAALVMISMSFQMAVVSYASSDYWDYDDFSGNSLSSEWTVDCGGNNVAKLNKENGNFELNKLSDSDKAGLYYNIPTEINSGKVAIEFSFYMNGTDDKDVQIKGFNSKGNDLFLYRMTQNRKPSIRNEDSGYTELSSDILSKGKEYSFKIVLDFDASTENISTYINSVESPVKKGFLNSATVSNVKKIGFYLPASSSYKGGGIVVDDFKIYYVDSDGESVLNSYTSLDLGDTSEICENLTLPTSNEFGANIKWESDRPEVVSDKGVITRSYFKDEDVVLTALISKNNVKISKIFNVTVLKSDENPTDEELVAKTKESLDLGDISNVTENLNLPEYYSLFDTVIKWESKNESVVSNKGVVTRQLSDETVRLIATIVRGDASDTKIFDVYVPRYMPEYSEPVSVFAENTFTVSKQAGQESTSLSISKNLSEKATNIVTISFDYTLSGKNGQYVDFNIVGTKDDESAFDGKIRFTGGGYVQLRNPDPVTGKAAYVSLSDKTDNEKHNIRLRFNTLFHETEIWIDDEKCDVGSYIPYDLKSINSVNWSIPKDVGGLDMLVENAIIEKQIKYKDSIKKDIELLNIGNTDGVNADFELPAKGEYGSVISWVSSDKAYIDVKNSKAIIKRPAALTEKETVTLTATVKAGEFEDTTAFECTLYGLNLDDLGVSDGKTDELILPKKWEYDGTDIEWTSDDVSVIERKDGFYVSGMLISGVSEEIELTATIKNKSTVLGSKKFNIILENPGYYDLTEGNSKHPEAVPEVSVSSGMIDEAGVWVADINDTKPSYQVDFGCELYVNSAELKVYGSVTDYIIETSTNGSNWVRADVKATMGDGGVTVLDFDRVNARYLRYSVKEKSGQETGLISLKAYYRYSDELHAKDNLDGINIPTSTEDDIKLPTEGSMGLPISWSSADTDVITNSGVVTREGKDVVVNMKAQTTKNGKSFERIFPVTVIGTGKTSSSSKPSGGGGGGGGGYVAAPRQSVAEAVVPSKVLGFNDIPDSHWAKEAVYSLYGRGIINGTSENTFEPDRAITRAEFVKLIATAFNIPKTDGKKFDDVQSGSWYYEAVCAAADAGIVNGMSANTFAPNAEIKRQDMAVILKNLAEFKGITIEAVKEETLFNDADEISDYAKESVMLLTSGNIISGNSENLFKPKSNATRAEAARLIYVILQLTE